MFCDRCGTQLAATQAFCPSCGKAIQPIPSARPVTGRVENHIQLLSIFWMLYALFHMLSGWFLTRFFGGFGNFWMPHMPFFLHGILNGIGMMTMAVGLAGLLAGWGLHERQPWARTLAIVMGVLVLFHFGLGTVLGIYTLWVLLPAESAQEYQRTARAV
jgi:hypothetical protein